MVSSFRRLKPGVEALEGREVPAVLTWTGAVSTAFDVAGNWRADGAPAARAPEAGDELVFDASAVNPDCFGVRGFGLPDDQADFAAVRLLPGYAGTVTLAPEDEAATVGHDGLSVGARQPARGLVTAPDPRSPAGVENRGVAVGVLEVRGGALAQLPGATELTALSAFEWTGGVLGGTAGGVMSHSAVNVRGGAAAIAPGGEGLVLGSTLVFEAFGGSVTALAHPGVIDLLGGDGVVIGGGATFTIAAPQPEATLYMRNVLSRNTAVWNVRRGGFFEVIGPGAFDSDRLPMVVSDGAKFRISGGATAAFGGQVPAAPGPAKPSVLVDDAAVGVEIENGGTLRAANGVELWGGYLKTFAAPGELTATVDGNLVVSGAAVHISEVPGFVYGSPGIGRLNVNGNVRWTAGAYHADVDGSAASAAGDLWYCTGTFEVGAGVAVVPGVVDPPYGGVPTGRSWLAVEAGVAIQGSVPAVPAGWEIVTNAGPVKKWFLRVS
ncbi:MAG: hypothetical protein C0501_02915 [Isosphaera sp.]|nr:hypothetical protein [Isosphaera sp.]